MGTFDLDIGASAGHLGPMRRLLWLCVFAPAAGCGVACDAPTEVNGTYSVFANTLTHEGTNLENFPSYSSPANGWSEWTILWDEANAAITVAIDGQSYGASGSWDGVECGTFDMAFGGAYDGGDGSVHAFTSTGNYVTYADHLEGVWHYEEAWSDGGGQVGDFEAEGQVSGQIVDP